MPSNNNSSQRGATLIEVLIYILVFSFVMSAALISVNQILSYSHTASSKSSVEQQAEFVLAKISWMLNGTTSVDLPSANSSGSTLRVTKSTGQITMTILSDDITVNGDVINSDWVRFSNLNFEHIRRTGAATTDSVKASFYANGKYFEIYRTIR